MAKGTAELETPKGPAVTDEGYDIPVFEAEDTELLQTVTTEEERVEGEEPKAEAPAKAEPKPERPTPEPVPVPVAEAKPVLQRPLTPIEREERRKRKDAQQHWKEALAEQDRLRARIADLNQDIEVGEFKVPMERVASLKARAAKADDLGMIAEMAFTEAAQYVHERDQAWSRQFKRQQFLNKVNNSWLGAQIRYGTNFLDTLQKSGLYAEIAERSDGTYANPYLARKVYLAPDPGEEAYQLAVGRLEYEQGKITDPDEEKEPAMPTKPVAATPVPTPTPAPKAEAEREAEAERRGAQTVIEKVESIANKPKGIAGLRSAGQPKTRWSKAELDQLQQRNPDGYERLVGKHPDLLKYHLS